MMTIAEWLTHVRRVTFPRGAAPVFANAARRLAAAAGATGMSTGVAIVETGSGTAAAGPGIVALGPALAPPGGPQRDVPPTVAVTFGADGSGTISATADRFLYSAVCHLVNDRLAHDVSSGGGALTLRPAFAWNRSCYDLFLAQEGRVQRGLRPETYVRRLAESGFTHVEVNALAYPMALETGPKGEVYPMFYTYCPALDQFVC